MHIVMAYLVMLYMGMASIVVVHVVMAYIFMACIVMACMVMAYIVMACIVMANGYGIIQANLATILVSQSKTTSINNIEDAITDVRQHYSGQHSLGLHF